MKKKIVYITAFIPFGQTESFILEEIRACKEIYEDIIIVPRNPPAGVFHQKAQGLIKNAIWLPLFNIRIILGFLGALFSLKTWAVMQALIRHSRNWKIRLKNLVVLPKSLYVAALLKNKNVGHIHAHWASTTATMAYIIHRVTDIPYSFTAHRWDVYENNMLKEKIHSAVFARCISRKGRDAMLDLTGNESPYKVQVIHMGVDIPHEINFSQKSNQAFTIVTPANLLPVKGHQYMIEACKILKNNHVDFKYWIIGQGPLELELKKMVEDKGLTDRISFLGQLPHEKLIQIYREGSANVVVLPSINTSDNEHEGIPVALMEAMSYGLPVISTNTGSISELLIDNCGIMVMEKDPLMLAQAVEKLIKDPKYRQHLSMRGRIRIDAGFNLHKIAPKLVNLMGGASNLTVNQTLPPKSVAANSNALRS